MRPRVELARALAGDSDILLLDEPFSSVDYLTRLRMRQELARLIDERPRTVVLVTRDMALKAGILTTAIEMQDLVDRSFIPTEIQPARLAVPNDPGHE
jgi:NitT/TauT family transport system ATP-binding protein